MPTALIIGASRGIGHEIVRQYRHDGWRVIATARTQDACDALTQLGAEAHLLDVTDVDGCAALGWKLDDEKLDVAILNAGVYGPRHDGFPSQEDFDAVMHTNVLAAMHDLDIPHSKINIHGGACALGHPIGASGARIIVTLLGALKKTGGKRGVAALCIGGGEATAMAIELV